MRLVEPPASASPPPTGDPSGSADAQAGSVVRAPFGKVDGQDVELFTLTNTTGMVVKVITYGAAISNLIVPDREGQGADVVLGFDHLAGYTGKNPFLGVTVGRVANRIRDGKFTLEGRSYGVQPNDGNDHLHGGPKGWDKLVWQGQPVTAPEGPSVRLCLRSPDGDEGYPGNVDAEVIYALDRAANRLTITMRATTDRTTLVNLAQHSYFNLAGEGAGTILDHELRLHASAYTPGDPTVPTGEVKPVQGTPFDFVSAAKPVGRDLQAVGGQPVGYDHNFVVDGPANALRPVARLKDPKSGRVLSLEADQPGVQLYSGNFLDGTVVGKGGHPYAQYTGMCLETQRFPNAINIPAWREQVILHPGETYAHRMVLGFSAE